MSIYRPLPCSSHSPLRNPNSPHPPSDLSGLDLCRSMGKRKERRLAAKSAAGRRVKLDLVAEPSGEMVDTSLDEVGGDPDQDHCTGDPMSPSSGQRQANPLSLLGQYSDDESDEEANKQPKHAVDRSSSPDLDGQVEEPIDAGSNTAKDMTDHNDQQEPDPVGNVKEPNSYDTKENDFTPEAVLDSEVDPPPQICAPEASGMLADGDTTGGWKMVLHEQSNRYYYWNTVSGETSWDTPSVLALETHVAGGQDISSAGVVDMHAPTHVNNESAAYAYVTAVEGIGCGNPISEHAVDYGTVMGIGNENSEVHFAYDANQSLAHYSTGVAGISYQGSSMLPEYDSLHQSQNVLSEQLTTLEEHHVASQDMDKHFTEPSSCYEGTDAHSARLVKYSETLLQRLKTLYRSGHNLEGRESIMKEIEVRLSDCKALSSYGSLLLPFWWHTETQLKQLESAISNGEATLLILTDVHNKTEEKPEQSSAREDPPQDTGAGPELIEDKTMLPGAENNYSSLSNHTLEVQIEDSSQIPNAEDVKTNMLSCGSSDLQLDREQGQEIVLETHSSTILVSNPESHVEEDMDMDVEMEVDEETPGDHTAGQDISSSEFPAPPEEPIQPNPPSSPCPAVPSDEPNVPPPPDEEWIPPPPPDSELVPPPPPEEPPAPFPPPPYADTVPCLSYQGQYDLGYTVQTYENYAPVASEVTNGNYYAHNEGTYTIEPQQPPCYAPVVASVFPEVPVEVNPVDPVAYYGISSETILNVPVVSSTGSSEFYVERGPISYHVNEAASDQTASVGFTVEHGTSSLPEVNLEPSISEAPSFASTAEAAATTLVNGSTADALPSAVPKNQSKVMRSKKRTLAVVPSLRSNKKVSSLVDKWKAAKEELHGEEDEEPQSAYEILEKKRQKDIEEWRARQIANGEARDNANFLPLGGDWRERVKRKKAKAEAVQRSSDAGVGDEKKQPDLVGLSKDLPTGWQAYWDESTMGVYYGNTITSEATWSRPTR